MKKKYILFLCTIAFAISTPLSANIPADVPLGEPERRHTKKARNCDASTQTEKTIFNDKKTLFETSKKFFQEMGDIKINSRSVTYLLSCEIFKIKIGFDLLKIKNFFLENQGLAQRILKAIEQILEKLQQNQDLKTHTPSDEPEPNRSYTKKFKNKHLSTLVEEIFSTSLIDSLEAIFDLLKKIVTQTQDLLSNAQEALSLSKEQLQSKKDEFLKKLDQDTLEKILSETLENDDIQKLINFFQTKVPHRICEKFAKRHHGFLYILTEAIKKYSAKLKQALGRTTQAA